MNRENRSQIDELEIKNKLLNDKLNGQIFQHATMYKEQTMNALAQSRCAHPEQKRSMSPLRNHSNDRCGAGNTDSAFARSPLGVKRNYNVQPSSYV